jgi:hypothetical protein
MDINTLATSIVDQAVGDKAKESETPKTPSASKEKPDPRELEPGYTKR